MATLDLGHYDDPATLYNASPLMTRIPVSTTISGSTLTINPPEGMVGVIYVTLTVSDGIDSHNQSFTVQVSSG